jgi:hypothetical protein
MLVLIWSQVVQTNNNESSWKKQFSNFLNFHLAKFGYQKYEKEKISTSLYIYMTTYYKSSDFLNDLFPIYGDLFSKKNHWICNIKIHYKKRETSA